jgi:hypothetical protein
MLRVGLTLEHWRLTSVKAMSVFAERCCRLWRQKGKKRATQTAASHDDLRRWLLTVGGIEGPGPLRSYLCCRSTARTSLASALERPQPCPGRAVPATSRAVPHRPSEVDRARRTRTCSGTETRDATDTGIADPHDTRLRQHSDYIVITSCRLPNAATLDASR